MPDNTLQVTNLNLIGFRVVQRVIERSNIFSQLWSLQAFEKDPILSDIAFIEEMRPGADGQQEVVGDPYRLITAKAALLEQAKANTEILRQLVAAYKVEKQALANPVQDTPEV